MFVLSLGGFIYFIFSIYYITFLAAVLYIDVHGWKSRGAEAPEGVFQILPKPLFFDKTESVVYNFGFILLLQF